MNINEIITSDEFNEKFGEAEIWKTIKDCPKYMVSTHGRVKNIKTGRILKTMCLNSGYLYVNLCNESGIYHYCVHRLVAETFLDKTDFKYVNDIDKLLAIKDDLAYIEVCHKNSIKTDNRLCNLEYGTHKYNCNNEITIQRYSKPKSEEHKHNISEAKKRYYQGKRLIEDGLMVIEESLNLMDEAVTVDDENECLEINF